MDDEEENIEIARGDQFSLDVEVTDEDDAVVDITGATLMFTVKKDLNRPDSEAIILKNVTVHTNPVLGLSSIALLNADTDKQPGEYEYSVRIKFASGDILTWLPICDGKCKILNHATKRTTP